MKIMKIMHLLQGIIPLLAALTVCILLAAKFSGTIKKFYEGDASTITLTLVTVLCAAYGVERRVSAAQLDKRLSDIEEHISKSPGARLLDNNNDIYRAATSIAGTADLRIRAMIVSTGPKAPSSFAETIARRLKEKLDAGYSASYDTVLVLNSKQIIDLGVLEKANNARLAIYKKYGVKERVHVYVIDTEYPTTFFDVMVVDRKHIHIGFTSNKDGKTLDNGIEFVNQSHTASSLADWYDTSILPIAKPLDEWLKERRAKI